MDGYDSTCPQCGAVLTAGGCMSCGYPNGTLRDRTAADTALADKSKGDTPLGHVRIESLLEAFENLAYVRQQLADTKQQLEETKWECRNLEAENAKLRACVKAADAYFQADANSLLPLVPQYTEQQIKESEHWLSVAVKHRDDYVAARAGVDKP